MVILISGPTHSGKTKLALNLMKEKGYPVLSLDHLKMGLIRSNMTDLTPYSNKSDLTNLLWPIVKEMIKTVIENKQDLIVEGIYIPYNFKDSFDETFLKHIKYLAIIFSEEYINNNFDFILEHANDVEDRLQIDENFKEQLISNHKLFLQEVQSNNLNHVLISENYEFELDKVTFNL